MAGSSFLDQALDQAKEIGVKAKDAVAKNSDKIDGAVDKAADFVDDKTKGKYAEQVSKVRAAAHEAVGKFEESPPGSPAASSSSSPSASGPADAPTPADEPPVVVPDPGLDDGPGPGPTAVDEGPPVATPDPGLTGTAGATAGPSGDAVPYPPEAPAPPPPGADWPGPTDAEYGAPAGIPDDEPWPGPAATGDEPGATPDPGAPEPG